MKAEKYIAIKDLPENSVSKVYVPTYICKNCGTDLKRRECHTIEKLWQQISNLIMAEIFDTPECEFCVDGPGNGQLKILELDDEKGHRKILEEMMALTEKVPRCNENILIDGKWEY